MLKTYGLTHLALAVKDLARSIDFYGTVVGARVVYRDGSFVQLQTPGSRDVMVLERSPRRAGRKGGVLHFGFRLRRPEDIGVAIVALKAAGARNLRSGEFVPGEPYVFATDPDGYQVELWYEIPTPVDPPRPRARRKARAV